MYPALESADPDLVGIALVGVSGRVESVGDDHAVFTIMSVAKPFVLGLVGDAIGAERVRSIVGVNATGLAFNSAESIERMPGGRTNPMVNAGAIATTALTPGATFEDRWQVPARRDVAARGAPPRSRRRGPDVRLGDEPPQSGARATCSTATASSPATLSEAVELYTRQSCVALDVRDVATMGATIANGGHNPRTGEHVVNATMCHDVMAAMATAGLYETSGDWLWDVGLPGKSGISGAVVALSPGKGAIAAFSPRLDAAGNSIRGQVAAKLLSQELGLDVFAARSE